ncbi:MAG: geranylgeranyl reductase family protein [Anaerolineae bacterium]
MRPSYDVVIAGAGPAGAAAAFFLGQAGQKVLVLERQHLPRYKPCGGMFSANVAAQFPFSFAPVIERRVEAFTYTFGQRATTVPRPGQTMYCAMRDRLDYHIISHAQVQLDDGVAIAAVEERPDSVLVRTDSGATVTSHYLIGADGANSVVGRSLGWRHGASLGAAIEVEVEASEAQIGPYARAAHFLFGDVPWGYLWIFPKADHLSVGIGSFRPGGLALRPVLERVMRRFGIPLRGARIRGHALPFTDRRWPIASRRVLLAGDAAGLVDPLSGEGIRPAIKSARFAAAAILSEDLGRYVRLVDSHIRRPHAYARLLSHFFYGAPRLCYDLAVSDPAASDLFAGVLADTINHREVFLRLWKLVPPHLLARVRSLAGHLPATESATTAEPAPAARL